ncbi:MAG: insulinase family protein, partial [Lachnospiraceae bacterium]|nr:insulinase family protein [Lachnospiraceae bacterium]
SWLHDDLKPFIHIDANETFKILREKIHTDYYEKLIEEYFLKNHHKAVLVMKPKLNLLEQQEKNLKEKLKRILANMTQEEIGAIKADAELLEKFQKTEDTPENLAKIPVLHREDLKREAYKLYNEPGKIGDTEFVFHDVFTNGIGYLELSFELDKIPAEYYPYVGILSNVLFNLSTKNYEYGEIINEIDLYTGGIWSSTAVCRLRKKPGDCRTFVTINTKYKYEQLGKALELIREVATTSRFEDDKRLLEVLEEYVSYTRQGMISSGNSVAANRALSYQNLADAYNDVLSKLSLYRLYCDILDDYEGKKAFLIERLGTLAKMIFRVENMRIDFTGAREEIPNLSAQIEEFKKCLFDCEVEKGSFVPELTKKNEGFMAPSQVQYVCRAGNYVKKGLPYDGSLKVLKVMMGYEYLWMNVRVQGGAYGCSCNFAPTGESVFVSYRDPNLEKTVEVYEGAADFIRNFQADERTMTKYVIGAIGELDTPMTPATKGAISKEAYLIGVTEEDLQRERDEILATTPEKIRSLAKYVDAFMEDDLFSVVGNTNKIKENEKMFGTVENLL